MPILVAAAGTDLLQGDLLSGVVLHVTTASGKARAIACDHSLVVARDCAAAHKLNVTVAPVKKIEIKLARDDKTLAEVRDTLVAYRDGNQPDRFYLGTVLDAKERFAAHLDELSTIQVPNEPEKLEQWIQEHRIACLHAEFRTALRERLHWTFARPGFDDHEWYCDADLAWLAQLADAETKRLDAAVDEFKAARERLQAGGKAETGSIAAATQKITDAERKLEQYKSEVQLLLAAQKLRSQ